MGAFDYVMTETRNEQYMSQFTPEQLAFFYGMPAWAIACWAIAVWGGVLASLLLLMKKRLSVTIYLLSFIGMLIVTFQNFVLADGAKIMQSSGMWIMTILIFAISLLLVFYSRAMAKSGVLS